MNMREKIAHALMVKRGGKCLVKDWVQEAGENPNVQRALTDADAVLDALMEPTLFMQNAGWGELREQGVDPAVVDIAPVYTAMIRAAKEGK